MAEWHVYLDGILIDDEIDSFALTMSKENYCKELTLNVVNPDFYDQFDWTHIPSQPRIEVKIDDGVDVYSLGKFFVERPAYVTDPRSQTMKGIWGRSLTARLGPPFSKKITKTWDQDASLSEIVQELITFAGLTYESSYFLMDDYLIYGGSFQVTQQYPINALKNLLTLTGGLITTDLGDHIIIKPQEFEFNSPESQIDDSIIKRISEKVYWPDFGNRVKITATGTSSGYSISMSIPEPCLPADGTTATKVYARVIDKDGNPVDDIVVNWSLDSTDHATLSYSATNTGSIVISDEQKQADNSFKKVRVDFPPAEVLGIYSYKDVQKTHNYAAAGTTISSNLIELTGDLFKYCDQHLKTTYRVDGIATVDVTSTNTPGNVQITAEVGGATAKGNIYVENPCACPPSLQMFINPYTIKVGGQAMVVLYAEENGTCAKGGRRVYLCEKTSPKRGSLSWEFTRLGTVNVYNEKTTALNEIEGVTQCMLRMFPTSVSGVWRVDEDGKKTGDNLYASHAGKIVDLNTQVDTGEDLVVDYIACGAAAAIFTGNKVGTAKLKGFLPTTREEPLEATGTVSIVDEYSNDWATDDIPDDWTPSPDTDLGTGDGGDGAGGDTDFDDGKQEDQEPEHGMCFQTTDVSQNPSLENLCNRFEGIVTEDCPCETLCEDEFNKYGTTQGYDNSSYKDINELMEEQYPNESPNDPNTSTDYWQHYNEIKQDMINQCVDECNGKGQCSQCTITGPDAVTKPGTYQYAAQGGQGPYTWSVSGTGVQVDQNGLVTLQSNACGSFDLSITDSLGCTYTKGVRISNAGHWVLICNEACNCGFDCHSCNNIEGKFRFVARDCDSNWIPPDPCSDWRYCTDFEHTQSCHDCFCRGDECDDKQAALKQKAKGLSTSEHTFCGKTLFDFTSCNEYGSPLSDDFGCWGYVITSSDTTWQECCSTCKCPQGTWTAYCGCWRLLHCRTLDSVFQYEWKC